MEAVFGGLGLREGGKESCTPGMLLRLGASVLAVKMGVVTVPTTQEGYDAKAGAICGGFQTTYRL